MDNILEVFIKVSKNEGITITKLEQVIGASKGVLSRAIANNSDIQAKWLLKLVENYPHYNSEWLLTGRGSVLKKETEKSYYSINFEKETTKEIPLIPIEAISDYSRLNDPEIPHDTISSYKIPELEDKGAKYLIRVSGSSMYPKYNNGDLLACKPLEDLSFFQWGKPYVLDTEQGTIVKLLFPCIGDNESLECHSDNKTNYPPFKIPKSSVKTIAIIVGVIHLE